MKIKKIGEIEKIGNGGKFNAMYQEKNESDSGFKSGSIKQRHSHLTYCIVTGISVVLVW